MELARLEGRVVSSSYVVRVVGEIDASNASRVADEIAAMPESSASSLVIDLSETDYLDSAGIRMLFDVSARLEASGRSTCIAVSADSPIRQVLTLTEVHQVIPVAEDVDGAIRAAERSDNP